MFMLLDKTFRYLKADTCIFLELQIACYIESFMDTDLAFIIHKAKINKPIGEMFTITVRLLRVGYLFYEVLYEEL